MTLDSLGDEHVEGAAVLLAERHARHRAAEALLPELADPRVEVERAREAGGEGAVALEGGEVAGYLLGEVRVDRFWGRHAWVGQAGHAAREPECVRDLYAHAAERWHSEGADLHLALVPALPDALDQWFRLGFGHMQAHGLRESGPHPGPLPAGLVVREGSAADLEAAAPLLPLIWEHHRSSPTFTGMKLPPAAEHKADWEETLADPGCAYFVAELEGRLVGHVLLYPEEGDLSRPPGSVYLAVAATLPEVRGLGAGLALTERALAWAGDSGYATVHLDWRVTNLQSSRFFPARGFRPTFCRLARRLEVG